MDGETLAEAIRGAQRGDPAAFDSLVGAFSDRIFGFLFRMTASRHDAEDLMQEVFLRVVRMIGAYRHEDRFESWIFRIAANLARDRLRRVRRSPKSVATPANCESGAGQGASILHETAATTDAPEADLLRGEKADALAGALAKLPAGEREVIMLRHFSQMSFREIAEVTGTPLGTALARSHRGLARLRDIMTKPPGAKATGSRQPGESARESIR